MSTMPEEVTKKYNELIENILVALGYTTIQALIWGVLIFLWFWRDMNPLKAIMYVFFFGGELFLIAFFVFAIFPNALIIYDFISKRRNKDDNKKVSD